MADRAIYSVNWVQPKASCAAPLFLQFILLDFFITSFVNNCSSCFEFDFLSCRSATELEVFLSTMTVTLGVGQLVLIALLVLSCLSLLAHDLLVLILNC